MSIFDSAKALLDRWKAKPPPLSPQAVKQDRYDREVFDDILKAAPKLRDLVDDVGATWDYAEDLMADIFSDLWQGDPLLHSKEEVIENHRPNLEVLEHFRNTPEREALRPHTMHDEYGTAMAVIGTGSKLRDVLEDKKEEKERMQQAQEEAKRRREEAQAAMDALQQAADAAGQAPGDEEAEAALAAALAAAQAADQAAQEAGEEADQATQDLTRQLKAPVSQALREQAQEREEEAALCRAFGQDPGELQRMSFEERARLMALMHKSRLARFTQELGRFRLSLSGQRMHRVIQAREEAYSVELSNDLSRVLPSELVKLAIPGPAGDLLKAKFTLDLARGRLLSRKYRGKEKLGKGAIVAVLDCSGSMDATIDGSWLAGQPSPDGSMSREAWGKCIVLSLLDTAIRQKRDMEVILFSSSNEQAQWSFPAGQPVDVLKVMEMTEHFFNGGTYYETPLRLAMDTLVEKYNRDGKPKADIVLMTDDEGRVSETFTRDWLTAKERLQFRCFGIAIGGAGETGVLQTVSDNVRSIQDLTDASLVADIFQVV